MAAVAAVALAGCVDRLPGITGTQSIGVELVAPTDPGAFDRRLTSGVREVTVNLTAYDAGFAVDTSFDSEVAVYAQFLGTLTPELGSPSPLAKIRMMAGTAANQRIPLPLAFGPTTLWVDDGLDPTPTFATGTSPALWLRDPFISDIQSPADETSMSALSRSPLEAKQVSVSGSRHGDLGRLVVTSVFSQGYTVSDVLCQDAAGTPPCTAGNYDHLLVFSFSAPSDQMGRRLRQGQRITGFSGGVQEFNGLTELGFPATTADDGDPVPDLLPAPAVIDRDTWFAPLGDPQGIINFERHEAGAIQVNGAKACPLDRDYERFNQWKLDLSVAGDCSSRRQVINVITAGVIADLDPATLAGKVVPRVVGVLRPVLTSGGPVWIIFPRSAADLTLPPP